MPRTIWERMTPELPRAPMSEPLVTAAATDGMSVDVALLELLDHGAHGERHVGARVAVRDRVDVEVVDELALSLDGGERGLDDSDGGGADDQSWRSSTRTLISPTGTPPTRSTW